MISLISPTPAGFAQLAAILSSLADSRTALGEALISATGNDAGLYADAAQLRRKAATPQKFWHFVTNVPGMPGQGNPALGLLLAQSRTSQAIYGPEIAAAASSPQVAADACLAARDAQLMAAQAGKDLALWLARHGASGAKYSMIAHLDEQEAEHLSDWARQLRP